MRGAKLLVGVGLMSLSACAATRDRAGGPAPASSAETIAISVGPCFGFCPVYDVSLAPDGTVTFSGKRHTAVVGDRQRRAGRALFQTIGGQLAPFRPADGTTAHVDCDAAISDTSSYTITWTRPDGVTTTATHQKGCSGGPGQRLDAILAGLPKRLGIAAWAQQVTRPGVSRG